jgi:hypothetical protein
MDFDQVNLHLEAYKEHNQILDAANFIISSFQLENENFEGFGLRDDEKPNYIVVTTEGDFRGLQKIMIPKNLFDFDLSLVLNLLAHEMLHVRQKTQEPIVEDKNEREWQAYYEMLFHKNFPQIPDAPDFNRKQFAEKAFEYYKRMGEGSALQQKYADEKKEVEKIYDEILIKRGEKPIE